MNNETTKPLEPIRSIQTKYTPDKFVPIFKINIIEPNKSATPKPE